MIKFRSLCAPAVALLAASLAATPAHAQRSPLDSIARLAVERNLAIRQARETERQSAAEARRAKGLLLPAVGVDARYSEFTGVIDIGDAINPAYAALNQLLGQPRFPTNISQTLPFRQETRLRSSIPLFNGAIYANLAAARAIASMRGAERAAATRRLDADARIAYLNYARAIRAVEIWDAALPTLAENLRVAERLLSAGTLTGDAVHRARAAKADGDQQRAEAVRLRDAALGSLNLLLDRELDTPVPALADSLLPDSVALSLADALARAARREERLQTEAGADAARAQSRAATSAFLPSLALAADYGIQGKDYRFDQDHDVGIASVVLSWNLFNGGQDARRREIAASAERSVALRAAETDRLITLDVRTAFDAAQTARAALIPAGARLDAARRAFQFVDRRFGEGLASHLEWSDARSQLTAAEQNLALTRYTLAARIIDFERAAALRVLP
ncbi:MAG: TolC family protein [Gemmatimonadaceae bacterium]|nr:TolC family protein [Gemmatimonadaceae bacterium]